MVEISREERDAYLIPQNFVDTGTILGGTVKLRNAVEAAVLAVGSAIPLFYLPMAFNIRLMIVIAVSVPLGVFGVVGIGGDSLTRSKPQPAISAPIWRSAAMPSWNMRTRTSSLPMFSIPY